MNGSIGWCNYIYIEIISIVFKSILSSENINFTLFNKCFWVFYIHCNHLKLN